MTTAKDFLKAGNIITAVARGQTETAQRLLRQASPEVKSIVQQQAQAVGVVISRAGISRPSSGVGSGPILTGRKAPEVLAAERAARETVARREAEISSFRGQASNIEGQRGGLEREQASIEAEGRRIESLRADIERRQASLITRGTVATNRLVLEFNKKSATLNQKAEAFGKKVDAFNVNVSQSNIRAGELNIQPVSKPFVKEFVSPREIAPDVAPFGLEARQTRAEIQRQQEELRAFREKPTPKPFGLEPITDFPKFVEERTAAIRKKGQELFEMAAFEQATFFKPKPDIPKRKVKGIEKRAKVGLTGLEIGTGAAGLGFVALGEPVIGALPETPVKFVDIFGVERELTPGGFRSALGLSGELAFVPAVFKAPGAVRALPKAITATRLEFAGLKQPLPLGQRGKFVIFEKKGPKIKLKKISKAEARELRKQGIILGKPGELTLEPLPPVKITPAEAKRLRELGVLVKPTAPAKFVTPEPSPGIIPRGPKVKIPELGKFLDPARPLTFEEEQLLKSLRPLKAISRKPIKAIKPFVTPEPSPGIIPRGPKVKIPELGKFLDPARPLTFEEKALERVLAIQLKPTKPFFKPLVIKTLPKVSPPTTAALRQAPQLSFKEFAKQLKAVEVFGKPLPPQRFLGIPGSAKALAFGLPLRPKGKRVEEIDFFGTRLKIGELPSLGKELEFLKIKTKPLEIQRQKILQIPTFKTLQLPKLRDVTKVQPIISQKELQLILPKVAIVEARAERVKFAELQRFEPRLKQITLPRQRPIFRQPTPSKEVFKKLPRIPPFVFPILEVGKPRKRKITIKQQAFASFVKKKGKLVKVSKRPLHKNTALALSLFVADNTAARTATIRKTPGKPVGPKRAKPSLRKFRNPIVGGRMKAVPNLFIEKSRFAIDRPGEVEAITKKGLEALRRGFFKKKRKKTKRRGLFDIF